MQSDSETAFRRLEAWIEDCSSNHPYCGKPADDPKLPTRVIDVAASDRQVVLFESRGARGKYVALSHTWGSFPRLTATRQTFEDLKAGVAVSFLPKTFFDAIRITRRLGVRYIWIDCLCILQDDAADWEREAAAMTHVYRNAYLTIAASASSGSHSGCFPHRKTDSYVPPGTRSLGYETRREASGPQSCTVEYELGSQPGQRNRIHMFEEWMPGSKSHEPQKTGIGFFGESFDPLSDEPLSERGWTLQERLLSPRTIHYATDQMYFECESQLESEDGFKFPHTPWSLQFCVATQRIPFEDHGLRGGGVSFVPGKYGLDRGGGRWNGGWISLVENYSTRSLTVSNDKLSAIAGVARVIAEETGDRYFAGVWSRHLIEDLYWRVYAQEELFTPNAEGVNNQPAKGRLIGKATRPAQYRGPTWSWASLDGPVKFIPLSYSDLVARPRSCVVTPAGSDRFGRVSSARLEIDVSCLSEPTRPYGSSNYQNKGPIYEIHPYKPRKEWTRHGIPVSIDLGDERGTCVGAVHCDFADESLEFPCYALFLDPENALIIRSQDREPYKDDQGNMHEDRLVPKRILCTTKVTTNISRRMLRTPRESFIVWLRTGRPGGTGDIVHLSAEEFEKLREQSGAKEGWETSFIDKSQYVVRVGIGAFAKGWKALDDEGVDESGSGRSYDPKVDGKLLYKEGQQSWGVVTKQDVKIPVAIF